MNLTAMGAATNGLQHLRNYTRLHIAQANDEGLYTPTTGPRGPLPSGSGDSYRSSSGSSSDISGTGQGIQALQALSETDPAHLQEVAGLIAARLREAAATASNGAQLNNMADAFQAIADGAPLEDVLPGLADAVSASHSPTATSMQSIGGTGSISAYDLLGKIIASSMG